MIKTIYISLILLSLISSCDSNELDIVANLKSKNHTELTNVFDSTIVDEWVKKDSIFLLKFKETINNDPKNIIDILGVNFHEKENLGFGYSFVQASMGKGYVSIWYSIVFKENDIIAYELKPDLPKHELLTKRYLKFYKDIYQIDDKRIYNRYYNYKEMHAPLNVNKYSESMNENLKFLMTPFSGIEYGFSGGISGDLFTNRELYLKEKSKLSPETCITLMYSKNPAVRLLAIEHYLNNRTEFNNRKLIDNWIETVYNELPTIGTMEGCIVTRKNSKDLVEEYLKKKN